MLNFAPDGKKIFLSYTGEKQELEAWVLPFPIGTGKPRRILMTPGPYVVLGETSSWLPDNRRVVICLSPKDHTNHLWLVDTDSAEADQITGGITSEFNPGVSPDGKTLAFTRVDFDLDVISISLVADKIQTLLGTEAKERMASWVADAQQLAYVTNRSGTMEVWIRLADGSSRPAVTQDNFPRSRNQILMNPVLSPDGSRVIFTRQGPDGSIRNWIMRLSEGVPQRLNESAPDTEYAGTWSPDGKRFVFLQTVGNLLELCVVNVGSAEAPAVLRKDVWAGLPDWSPGGDWITFEDKTGWNLISADAKTVGPLGKISTAHLAFSRDGKQLYGMREQDKRVTLFSLELATGKRKDLRELGLDLAPSSDYGGSSIQCGARR
jgi:Tol biopolymer transport system component